MWSKKPKGKGEVSFRFIITGGVLMTILNTLGVWVGTSSCGIGTPK